MQVEHDLNMPDDANDEGHSTGHWVAGYRFCYVATACHPQGSAAPALQVQGKNMLFSLSSCQEVAALRTAEFLM